MRKLWLAEICEKQGKQFHVAPLETCHVACIVLILLTHGSYPSQRSYDDIVVTTQMTWTTGTMPCGRESNMVAELSNQLGVNVDQYGAAMWQLKSPLCWFGLPKRTHK